MRKTRVISHVTSPKSKQGMKRHFLKGKLEKPHQDCRTHPESGIGEGPQGLLSLQTIDPILQAYCYLLLHWLYIQLFQPHLANPN